MTTPKDEKRIRVTVKCQDEAKLKLLCLELLHEARAHKGADLKFYFWQQAYHIVMGKTAPIICVDPPLSITREHRLGIPSRIEYPEQSKWGFSEWSDALFVACCVGIIGGGIFVILGG